MTTRPMSTFYQGISELRRREVDRVGDMTAKDTTVSGRQLVQGVGQVVFGVKFPVTFTQRPLFLQPGAELDDGYPLVDQHFPGVVKAAVVRWETIKAVAGAFDGYFTGATVSVVVEGDSGQHLWIHWAFRGTGLRNPVQQTTDDLTDEL